VQLDRVVGLKMLLHTEHAGTDERHRFQSEARAVARLQHPHIVQIHEVGEYQGRPYFSLEFCPGGSLADRLDGTPWTAAEAAALLQTLARAMHAAHQANVIHRDLKPANVLLTEDGQAKITDFGLAKKLDEKSQTQTGAVVGTPSYMAPEQASGKKEVGPAADIYALGAILYELLTGRPPFKAATAMHTLLLVMSEEPVPVRRLQPQAPKDLETICHKCLHKDPHKRYASAAELAEDLRRFLAGEPIQARPVGAVGRSWRWCRRNRAVAGLLAVVAASLLLGAVLGSYAVSAIRAEAASQREKKVARKMLLSLLYHPSWARLTEEKFIERFLQEDQGVSYEDVKRALHESGWTPSSLPPSAAEQLRPPTERGAEGGESFIPAMFGD
jgi:hypothetical protein